MKKLSLAVLAAITPFYSASDTNNSVVVESVGSIVTTPIRELKSQWKPYEQTKALLCDTSYAEENTKKAISKFLELVVYIQKTKLTRGPDVDLAKLLTEYLAQALLRNDDFEKKHGHYITTSDKQFYTGRVSTGSGHKLVYYIYMFWKNPTLKHRAVFYPAISDYPFIVPENIFLPHEIGFVPREDEMGFCMDPQIYINRSEVDIGYFAGDLAECPFMYSTFPFPLPPNDFLDTGPEAQSSVERKGRLWEKEARNILLQNCTDYFYYLENDERPDHAILRLYYEAVKEAQQATAKKVDSNRRVIPTQSKKSAKMSREEELRQIEIHRTLVDALKAEEAAEKTAREAAKQKREAEQKKREAEQRKKEDIKQQERQEKAKIAEAQKALQEEKKAQQRSKTQEEQRLSRERKEARQKQLDKKNEVLMHKRAQEQKKLDDDSGNETIHAARTGSSPYDLGAIIGEGAQNMLSTINALVDLEAMCREFKAQGNTQLAERLERNIAVLGASNQVKVDDDFWR